MYASIKARMWLLRLCFICHTWGINNILQNKQLHTVDLKTP